MEENEARDGLSRAIRMLFLPDHLIDFLGVELEEHQKVDLGEGLSGRVIPGFLIADDADQVWQDIQPLPSAGPQALLFSGLVVKNLSFLDVQKLSFTKRADASQIEESLLSPRELEVLRLVAKGARRSEVAQKLSISVFTYDTHRRNIRQKLGVSSLGEMIEVARQMGLLD